MRQRMNFRGHLDIYLTKLLQPPLSYRGAWLLVVLLRKKNLGKSDKFCSQFVLTRLYKIFAIHKNTAVWIYSLRNLWETAVKSHGCYNLCVFVDLNFFLLKFFYRENLLRELFAEIHKTSFLPLFPFPSFWTDRTFYANKKKIAIKNLQTNQNNMATTTESDCSCCIWR